MIDLQSHFVFPTHAVPPAGPLRGGERLEMTADDGANLRGVHFAGEGKDARTLILGFGGNAWNGQDVGAYLHDLYPDQSVVAFHYRGYRPSDGDPSAEALVADAPLIYDYAVGKLRPSRVIAVGFSIGSAVAATLSAARKLDGMILVTPFDSLKAVAQAAFPWLPIAAFFSHEIDAAEALRGNRTPTALIAAAKDEIVPGERTAALRSEVGNLLFDRTVARAGHNDLYARSDFHSAMHDALDALTGAG